MVMARVDLGNDADGAADNRSVERVILDGVGAEKSLQVVDLALLTGAVLTVLDKLLLQRIPPTYLMSYTPLGLLTYGHNDACHITLRSAVS